MVEHRVFRLGDSIVICSAMQFREKSPYIAARRLAFHPIHGCQRRDVYYVVYEAGKRLEEFQGKDL